MQRFFYSVVLLVVLVGPAFSGSVTLLGAGKPPGGGGGPYAGPGDVVSGAQAWWGLRAYTLALAGSKAANICNNLDANCADINTIAVTGNFDVATAQGAPLNCGGAGGTCTVKTVYDQTVGLNCGASQTCDITQTTIASRPTLVFNCIGTLPCMAFNGSQTLLGANLFMLTAQPYVLSTACERTGAFTSFSDCIGSTPGGGVQIGMANSANTLLQYASSVVTVAGSDSVFHALNGVYNAASSVFFIDGSSNATNPGGGVFGGGNVHTIGNGNNGLTGRLVEAGYWQGSFSSGVSCASQSACLSALNSQQHSYWGF